MKGEWRSILLRLLMLGTIVLTTASFASPAARAAEMPRVRSSSPFIRGVIDEAMEASPTFRTVVAAIGATDGIVYVEKGVCRHGVHACLSLWVAQSAGFRFLRILLDVGTLTQKERLELIGTIGHELWHALEVLTERALTTTTAIIQFYSREFPTSRDTFETAAAISVGARVRDEVAHRVPVAGLEPRRNQCEPIDGAGGCL